MNIRELIQRAISIATQGMDSPVVRSAVEVAAEPLVPIIFAQIGDDMAGSERGRTILRRTKALTFVNGSVALPADVLTAYLCESTLFDPADITKLYSLVPWDTMVQGDLDTRLGHYAVRGEAELRVVEPDTAFSPDDGTDIALRLTVPCAPEVPADIDDDFDAPAEITDEFVKRLANALRPIATKAR